MAKLIQNTDIYAGITTCMTALSSMWVPRMSKKSFVNSLKMRFNLLPINQAICNYERRREDQEAEQVVPMPEATTPGRDNVQTFDNFLASPTLGGILLRPVDSPVDRTQEPRNSPSHDATERRQPSHHTPIHDTSNRTQQSHYTPGDDASQRRQQSRPTPNRDDVSAYEEFLAHPTPAGVVVQPLNQTVNRSRQTPVHNTSDRRQQPHHTPDHETSERSQQSHYTPGHDGSQRRQQHTPNRGDASAYEKFLAHPTPAGVVIQPLNETVNRSRQTPTHNTSDRRQQPHHTPDHETSERNQQSHYTPGHDESQRRQQHTPNRGDASAYEKFLAHPTPAGVVIQPLNETVNRSRQTPTHNTSDRRQQPHHSPGHDTSGRSQQSHYTSGHDGSQRRQQPQRTPNRDDVSAYEEFLAHPTPAGVVIQPLNQTVNRSRQTPVHNTSDRRQQPHHSPGHDTSGRSQHSHYTPGHDGSQRRLQPQRTPNRDDASVYEEFLAHPTPAGVVIQPLNGTVNRSRQTPAHNTSDQMQQSHHTPGHDTTERRQQSRRDARDHSQQPHHTPDHDADHEQSQQPRMTPSGGFTIEYEEFVAQFETQDWSGSAEESLPSLNSLSIQRRDSELPSYEGFADRLNAVGRPIADALRRPSQTNDLLYHETPERTANVGMIRRARKQLMPLLDAPDTPGNHQTPRRQQCQQRNVTPPEKNTPLRLNAAIDGESFYVTAILPDFSP